MTARGDVSYGLPAMWDWILVLGLTLCGMMSVSRLIANSDAMWWQAALLLVRALVHCVSLAVTLLEVWFYRRVWFYHAVSLD